MGLLTMMMPPQTNNRATMTVTGLVPAPSPSSSALNSTPKTGFIKPKTDTRLTGLTASQAGPQRVGDRGDKRHVDDERDGGGDFGGGQRAAHQKPDGGKDHATD